MKKPAIICAFLCASIFGYSQKIEHVDVRLDGEDLIITFDLRPKDFVSERYSVDVFSSRDGYTTPLVLTSGESKDVRPGNRLQYIINAADNFTGFRGDLDFKIDAKLTFSPITVTEPLSGRKFKKGSMIQISWRGGLDKDTYELDLYKDDINVSSIESGISTRNYLWVMPKNTKAGSYKLKVAAGNDPDNAAISTEFIIKKKLPLVVKLLPLFAIGAGVYVLTTGGGDSPETNILPGAPDPPGN